MFELTINGVVYQFNFGRGFVREINKTVKKPIDGMPDLTEDVGLAFMVAKLIDGDVLALVDALDMANKRFMPRITKNEIEEYIESEDTDIDELFKEVLVFLERANATKKMVRKMKEAMETPQEAI